LGLTVRCNLLEMVKMKLGLTWGKIS